MTRLIRLLKEFAQDGTIPLILGLVLLTVGALAYRLWVSTNTAYVQRLQHELSGLTAMNEPRVDDPYAAVAALALAPINRNIGEYRDTLSRTPAYSVAEDQRRVFALLAGEALALRKANTPSKSRGTARAGTILPDSTTAAVERCWLIAQNRNVVFGLDADQEQAWKVRARAILQGIARDESLTLRPTNRSARSLREWQLGSSWTESAPLSQTSLLIPATLAISDSMKSDSTRTPRFSSRVRLAAQLSRLLELIVNPSGAVVRTEGTSDGFEYFQCYFISIDHVLRIWQSENRGNNIADQLPRIRSWFAAYYATRSLATDLPQNQSMAYIDYAMGGVSITESEPVLDASGHLLGILATDFRVPWRPFVDLLAVESELLTVERIVLPTGPTVAASDCKVSTPALKSRWLRVFDYEETTSDRRHLRWEPVGTERQTAVYAALMNASKGSDFARHLTPLDDLKPPAFFIPLNDFSRRERVGVVISTRNPSPPPGTLFALSLVLLLSGAAILGIVLAILLGAQFVELERRRTLFRALQVGVLRLDDSNVVVEANDRCEEIFTARLPKPGIRSSSDILNNHGFHRLLADDILILRKDAEIMGAKDYEPPPYLVRESAPSGWRWASLSKHVDTARKRGFATTYVGVVRLTGVVVILRGSPLFDADGDNAATEKIITVDRIPVLRPSGLEFTQALAKVIALATTGTTQDAEPGGRG